MSITLRGSAGLATQTAATSLTVATFSGWAPSAPQAGDILVVGGLVGAASQTVTKTAGTGTWVVLSSDNNSGSGALTTFAAYSVMQSGDTAPTFGWSSSASSAYVAFALTPDTGFTIAFDKSATVLLGTTAGTSFTANAATTAGTGEASVILTGAIRSATGASSPGAYTPPSGWTTVSTALISGSAGVHGIEFAAAYQVPVSGTVTPGAETFAASSFANAYHLLIKESSASVPLGAVLRAQARPRLRVAPRQQLRTGMSPGKGLSGIPPQVTALRRPKLQVRGRGVITGPLAPGAVVVAAPVRAVVLVAPRRGPPRARSGALARGVLVPAGFQPAMDEPARLVKVPARLARRQPGVLRTGMLPGKGLSGIPVPFTRLPVPRLRVQPRQRITAGQRGSLTVPVPVVPVLRDRQANLVPIRIRSQVVAGQRGSLTVPVPVPAVLRHRAAVRPARSRLVPSPFAPVAGAYPVVAQRTQLTRPAWRLVRQPRQRLSTGMLPGKGLSGIPPIPVLRDRQPALVPVHPRNAIITGQRGSLTVPVPVPVVLRHKAPSRRVTSRLTWPLFVPPATAPVSPGLEGYGFGSFPLASGKVTAVIGSIGAYGSDAAMGNPSYQLWDGTTALIDTEAGAASTSSSHVDTVTFAGAALVQLGRLRARIYAQSALGNSGATGSADFIGLTAVFNTEADAAATPGTLNATAGFPQATVLAVSNASAAPGTLTATAGFGQCTTGLYSVVVPPATLAVTAGFPQATVLGVSNASAAPGTLNATAAFGQCTTGLYAASVSASPITATAGFGQCTASGVSNATATPGTLAATAAFGQCTTGLYAAQAGASLITAAAGFPQCTASGVINATATPGTLTATAGFGQATVVTNTDGPYYAAAQRVLTDGAGTWATPANITGPPDGSVATWTVP